MDSKYNAIGNGKSGISKFKLAPKSMPTLFNNNNKFNSTPKKVKMNNNQEFHNKNQNSNNMDKRKLIQTQRMKLPIFEMKNKLLDLIRKNSTLVILGETGCGKTTQIPQYILSSKMSAYGVIGVTQPRRVAAVSVALRVADELESEQGEGKMAVGYCVRFEDTTTESTKIKFLTDGMLLREAMFNKLLLHYSVIILDEAHERTIHTDVLFGIVKNAQKVRETRGLKPLKIIIMSATMDVDHFSQYFNNCLVVYLEGRTYPVNLFYAVEPHEDYQTACVSTFFKIHRETPANHDVLIFLTGQDEIETVAHQIRVLAKDPEVEGPAVRVHTLYAAQANHQQMGVFHPTPENTRKVVISTNIAETSITISGIKYIIDCGMVKARTYHPTTGLELLKVQRISQEQAWQRTGRAGRESEGACYRLYTRSQFDMMQKSTTPEIQRANLSTVALELLALDIHAKYFDFLDKPSDEAVGAAFEQLKSLEAVERIDANRLTPLGLQMSKFPLDPRFSKILLSAEDYGCVEEILIIISLLSSESVLLNPVSKREQAQNVRRKFHSPWGDHITMLNIFREYMNMEINSRRNWCHEHYINMRNIVQVREVHKQLKGICEKCNVTMSSCQNELDMVRKCLLTGLFMNVAELHKDKEYITLDKKQSVLIHPSSVIYGQQPHFVVFTEVIQTNKCYIKSLTTIQGEWMLEVAPDYIRSKNLKISKSF